MIKHKHSSKTSMSSSRLLISNTSTVLSNEIQSGGLPKVSIAEAGLYWKTVMKVTAIAQVMHHRPLASVHLNPMLMEKIKW